MTDASTPNSPHDAMFHEHQELMSSIDALRSAWHASSPEELAASSSRIAGLRRLVERLSDDLAGHFAAEERGGYMSHVLRSVPGFSHQAAELESQHAEFLQTLGGVAELLTRAAGSPAKLQQAREEFDRLVERLLAHEHAETEMVQSAVTVDIGTGD